MSPPASSTDLPLSLVADGVRIAVRLMPRARHDRILGSRAAANGVPLLQVAVTAPPLEGLANEALLRLLAREFGLPRRDLAIVGGAKNRNKVVHVVGDPARLAERLTPLLAALPRS